MLVTIEIIEGFSPICSPLNRFFKRIYKWSPECSKAFEFLKAALIGAPILSYPSQEGTFILDCDASGNNIGRPFTSAKQRGKGYQLYK
ncbi:MAG: hypothetical protein H0A75_08845 [Candidatus Methanofishera endochildressiae]|uniref:Reverse transcriptase/retrotransposon-derived protein RNase H-like domain-containing protein n=1 Tax=Candidatus Methanofishera endochildressiae TaxID=2738884 RepID=A0A7Z0MQN7_9GAMM|nr:hypothetical protein [Candidatus Methanofishera endochildressiae]